MRKTIKDLEIEIERLRESRIYHDEKLDEEIARVHVLKGQLDIARFAESQMCEEKEKTIRRLFMLLGAEYENNPFAKQDPTRLGMNKDA